MTTFTEEIRETVSPHKFGGDRMAAALWLLSMESLEDERTGDASEWDMYVARFGRRLLLVNSRGFVSVETYPCENDAHNAFVDWDNAYDAAIDEGDDSMQGGWDAPLHDES